MRVTIDATPLLGHRTGVGRYVHSLARALAALPDPDDLRGIAFTARGRRALPGALPPGVRAVGPPAPARVLNQVWGRAERPTVGMLCGGTDVFHATNFVLPPPGRAAGVVTVHDLSFLRRPATVTPAARAYQHLVPLSVRRAATVLTPSVAVAAEVAETYGLTPDRVVATPLGVDESWYGARPPSEALRRRLGLGTRWFVFAGNLEPRKNLPVLLKAYRELLAQQPDSPTLALVGPPGWGPRLDLTGLPTDKLVLTGPLADEDLQALVAGATALVYPSAYEGFGLPPLEAFACGTPVVASDLPVVREVIGEAPGLADLVPAGEVPALGQALSDAATATPDPELIAARRARARRFGWEATARATREVYRRAVR